MRGGLVLTFCSPGNEVMLAGVGFCSVTGLEIRRIEGCAENSHLCVIVVDVENWGVLKSGDACVGRLCRMYGLGEKA